MSFLTVGNIQTVIVTTHESGRLVPQALSDKGESTIEMITRAGITDRLGVLLNMKFLHKNFNLLN
jgi:hypothetical protein